MTHPDQLLPDYVDGTLTPEDRAAVDAHLASCDRCRGEVDVSGRAARALASLPELAAPAGLADAAIEESSAPRPSRAAAPRWYRAAAITAAAATIALVALTLSHVGTSSDHTFASSPSNRPQNAAVVPGASDGEAATTGAATLLHQRKNYDAAALQDLAGAAASGVPPTGTPGTGEETTTALECLLTAGVPTDQQLRTLVAATFRGTPAYVAVIAQGPGGGQPADRIAVWAIDSATCQLLSFAQQPI